MDEQLRNLERLASMGDDNALDALICRLLDIRDLPRLFDTTTRIGQRRGPAKKIEDSILAKMLQFAQEQAVRLTQHTIITNDGVEITGQRAYQRLDALRQSLLDARNLAQNRAAISPVEFDRDAELNWLYEVADFEITDEVLDFIYQEGNNYAPESNEHFEMLNQISNFVKDQTMLLAAQTGHWHGILVLSPEAIHSYNQALMRGYFYPHTAGSEEDWRADQNEPIYPYYMAGSSAVRLFETHRWESFGASIWVDLDLRIAPEEPRFGLTWLNNDDYLPDWEGEPVEMARISGQPNQILGSYCIFRRPSSQPTMPPVTTSELVMPLPLGIEVSILQPNDELLQPVVIQEYPTMWLHILPSRSRV